MQVLVGLNNKNILDYLDYTNSFIIGLKDFSINYLEYSIDEIELLKSNYPQIELFVSINKSIFNSDLKQLEEMLIKLDKIGVAGVFFYDLSVLSLCQKHQLHLPLVVAQEHMTTNYNICNYYYQKGCSYIYLSNEITEEDIKEIKEKTKASLISFVFGYPDVSFSKRKLLTNYFLYHNQIKEKNTYIIGSDDNHQYLIKESKLGSRILSYQILNGLKPFCALDNVLDYAILSEEEMEHTQFLEVLKIFCDVHKKKISHDQAQNMLRTLYPNADTNFYYRKTIYKVKDEK